MLGSFCSFWLLLSVQSITHVFETIMALGEITAVIRLCRRIYGSRRVIVLNTGTGGDLLHILSTCVCLGRQATFSLPNVGVIRSVKHPRRWRFLQVQTSSVTGRVLEYNYERESSKASQRVMLAWPLTVYPPDLYSFDSETWDGSRKETWPRQPCEAHLCSRTKFAVAAEEKSRNACLDSGDNLF